MFQSPTHLLREENETKQIYQGSFHYTKPPLFFVEASHLIIEFIGLFNNLQTKIYLVLAITH